MKIVNGIALSLLSLATASFGFAKEVVSQVNDAGHEEVVLVRASDIIHIAPVRESSIDPGISTASATFASPYDPRFNYPKDPKKRCPELEPFLDDAGLQPVDVFSYIAWRESGCRPEAQNAKWDKNGNMTYRLNKDGSYDTGLLQINSSWRTVTRNVCGDAATLNNMQGLKDIECNLAVARWIMDNSAGKLGNWRVYEN